MTPLLNYTTSISVEKTASQIMEILARHGATAVLLEYDRPGEVGAISFKVKTSGGGECGFRLPTNWRATQVALYSNPKTRRLATEAQARRVAWRIVKDWVEAQMALLETGMVKMEQIFLPYMVANDGRTFYEVLAAQRFLLKEG
jgi:hypothetical protein